MEQTLTMEEVRVLGSLIEKEMATPDYYPLTLNALINACNQKSNREPVVSFDDQTVLRAIDRLRDRNFAFEVKSVDSRVPKYEHNVAKALLLTVQEVAVLDVLLLRGPQTVGELRARTGRLYPFEDMDAVEITLKTLMEREVDPLVMQLPVQPGRKEPRYAHLLMGEPEVDAAPAREIVHRGPSLDDEVNRRVARLEEEVRELRESVADLKAELAAFRAQFE